MSCEVMAQNVIDITLHLHYLSNWTLLGMFNCEMSIFNTSSCEWCMHLPAQLLWIEIDLAASLSKRLKPMQSWLLPNSCSHNRSSRVSLANMRKLHSVCHVSLIYLMLPRLSDNLFMLVLCGPVFLQCLGPLFILHDRFYFCNAVLYSSSGWSGH